MAATEKKGKTGKIIVIIVLILIAVAVAYYFLKKTALGNKYGSADAFNAGKNGTYGTYSSLADGGFTALYSLAGRPMGMFSSDVDQTSAYGPAFFKGFNIKMSAENVKLFEKDAVAYMNNETIRKPHWDVQIGDFLKA